MKFLVGLGNPEDTYAYTRHNIGIHVISVAADNKSFNKKFKYSKTLKKGAIVLVKPTTFMNVSGMAAQEIISYYKSDPTELLVVCDDFAIPSGVLRLRSGGSSGGHKGLQSIIESLGSNNFARLRIGVGPIPEKSDPARFVLKKISSSEKKLFDAIVQKAAECIDYLLKNGIEKAMNAYNKSHVTDE